MNRRLAALKTLELHSSHSHGSSTHRHPARPREVQALVTSYDTTCNASSCSSRTVSTSDGAMPCHRTGYLKRHRSSVVTKPVPGIIYFCCTLDIIVHNTERHTRFTTMKNRKIKSGRKYIGHLYGHKMYESILYLRPDWYSIWIQKDITYL